MLIAGFDTETTGLDFEKDWIVEVAVVLWDTESPHRKAVSTFESLLSGEHLPPLTEEVMEIHGITDEQLRRWGKPAPYVLNKIMGIFEKADAICAHNGNGFDKPMLIANCKRLGIPVVDKMWIDTTCDVQYPPRCKQLNLMYLAAWHGFLNPFPHAAASDVLTMLQIADKYDWKEIAKSAQAPSLVIKANVSFNNKELAKKQSFRWDGSNKIWIKTIKDYQLDGARKAASDAGFEIVVLKG